MNEIVNLKRARKARARADGVKTATLNRVKFGRTKAEKMRERATERAAARLLDQAKRDRD